MIAIALFNTNNHENSKANITSYLGGKPDTKYGYKEVRSKAMSVFHFGRFILKFYFGSIAVLVLANALSTL
ncbi:hypothetical protein APA_4484 [Pseudanabaena sp. lw0831]|nr:hypothetical protein APA_4484 [Pseudanabaena sp. lw0831]